MVGRFACSGDGLRQVRRGGLVGKDRVMSYPECCRGRQGIFRVHPCLGMIEVDGIALRIAAALRALMIPVDLDQRTVHPSREQVHRTGVERRIVAEDLRILASTSSTASFRTQSGPLRCPIVCLCVR